MSAWTNGSTRLWRRIRAHVLGRDGYQCRAHLDGWCARASDRPHECTMRADLYGPHAGHAHHTLGRAVTGDDPEYIVAACRACNLHIGDPGVQADPQPTPTTRW